MAIKIGGSTIWNAANQASYSLLTNRPTNLVETVSIGGAGGGNYIINVSLSGHTLTFTTA